MVSAMNPSAYSSDSMAQSLIQRFNLLPHPEGGYYRETYRSTTPVQVRAGRRDASTAIYYLLEAGDYSAWHRIASDDLWHFYAGAPLHVHVLDAQGVLLTHRLGSPTQEGGNLPQVMVPAGCWFAAEHMPRATTHADLAGDDFALVGCTVAPGFEFSEFELADVAALSREYPAHAEIFRRLAPRST